MEEAIAERDLQVKQLKGMCAHVVLLVSLLWWLEVVCLGGGNVVGWHCV